MPRTRSFPSHVLLAALGLVLAAACGPGDPAEEAPPDNRPPVIAAFSHSPTDPRPGDPVTFTWSVGDPDGDALTCRLSVGDAAAAQMISPCSSESSWTHGFIEGGAHTVTLEVADEHGAAATASLVVTVFDPDAPTGGFTLDRSPRVGFPSRLTLTAEGKDEATLVCALDLTADGTFDATLDPCVTGDTLEWTWTAAGTYDVVLRIQDEHGAAYQGVTPVAVAEDAAPVLGLEHAGRASVRVGEDVEIAIDPVAAVDGERLRCRIDWVDAGEFTEVLDPCASTTRTHAYDALGTYTIRVRAETEFAAFVERTLTVDVVPNEPPSISAFWMTPDPVIHGQSATFGWTVADPEGDPLTCTLQVVQLVGEDDEAQEESEVFTEEITGCSNDSTVTHLFVTQGVHLARLRVEDGYGAFDAAQFEPVIAPNQDPVIHAFDFSPPDPRVGDEVTFTMTVSDPEDDPLSCIIDPTGFGYHPFTVPDCAQATYVYTEPGTFEVVLDVEDAVGNFATQSVWITVSPNAPPIIHGFESAQETASVGEEVLLSWSVSDPDGDPLTCSLDLGDGSEVLILGSCGTGHPVVFSAMGAYTVRLIVEDGRGGQDESEVEIDVNEHPFVVDTFEDTVDDAPGDGVCADEDGACSLRAAVMEANALSALDEGYGTYVIVLGAGQYGLTRVGTDEEHAVDGDLDVRGRIAIRGAGRFATEIQGNGALTRERVFHMPQVIPPARLELESLMVLDGWATGDASGTALSRQGGGFYVYDGLLRLQDVYVGGHRANEGGAIVNYRGVVEIYDSVLSSNEAGQVGGAIVLRQGPAVVTLERTTLELNTATSSSGGAAYMYGGRLEAVESTFVMNQADRHGGAIAGGQGAIVLDRVTLSSNSANNLGGGIYTLWASIDIRNSLFLGNAAHDGGAIRSGSTTTNTITNSTFSANVAESTAGAMLFGDGTRNRLSFVTVTGNQAATTGGVRAPGTVAELHVRGSIIAGNSANLGGDDCGGTVLSAGYNLFAADGGCETVATDRTGDPMLGALADNGGPTRTHALDATSPAVDAVPGGECVDVTGGPVTQDQRGVPRPQGTACDIGAFERE
jgi:CSLREA domain-containing protein